MRTIYLGSQRRPWYRKMQLLRSVGSFFYCSVMQSSVDRASVKAFKIYSKLIQGKADAAVLEFCCMLNVQN